MKILPTTAIVLALSASLLSGCSSSDSESEDTSETSGGNYISCVMEYNEARRAGILDATQQEITQECLSQYAP